MGILLDFPCNIEQFQTLSINLQREIIKFEKIGDC